jgi:hypothetical protein
MKHSTPALKRHTFATSRLLEFTSEKELALQTGHPAEQWPCVVAKELGDNAADACEEAGVAPDISFTVTTTRGKGGITVTDNAGGIPADTVTKLLDFSVRVSSREAYVAPCRGAQGNALKTIIMMPFVLGGDTAKPVIIEACGIRHSISISVDAVQQKPMVVHEQERSKKKNGTAITVPWPNVSLLTLRAQQSRFLQIVRTFALLNPHATIRADWDGERDTYKAIDADFTKWGPSDPTPPCWYNAARFERLAHRQRPLSDHRSDGTCRRICARRHLASELDKLDAVLAHTSTRTEDAALFAEMLSLPNDGRYPALELTSEQRRQRIVVGVGPGAVATPINFSTMTDLAKLAQLNAAIPLGRMARPQEIASVVGFLAGEGASYLTATTIFADGGIMHSSVGL